MRPVRTQKVRFLLLSAFDCSGPAGKKLPFSAFTAKIFTTILVYSYHSFWQTVPLCCHFFFLLATHVTMLANSEEVKRSVLFSHSGSRQSIIEWPGFRSHKALDSFCFAHFTTTQTGLAKLIELLPERHSVALKIREKRTPSPPPRSPAKTD